MKPIFQAFVQFSFALTFILCQKNSDEGRPYEFGFTIDGQQHRHEKKDENGIIQGEFGFITADGIYHVTVYATDENGNFKILSMKNIRISAPLDGSPATGPISPEASKYLKTPKEAQSTTTFPKSQPPQFQRLEQEPNTPSTVVAATLKPQAVFTTKPTIKPACAGCGYVTTSKTTTSQPYIGNEMIVQPSPQYPNIHSEQHSSERIPQYPIEITPLNYQDQSDFSQQYHNQYESNIFSKTPNETPQESLIVPNQPTPDVDILPPSFQSNSVPPSIPQQSVLSPGSNEYQQGNRQVQNPVYQQGTLSGKQSPSSASNKQNGDKFVSRNSDQVSDVPTDNLINLGNQTNQKEYVDILTNLPYDETNVKQTGRSGQLNTPPDSTATSKLPPITVSKDSIHIGGKNPKDIRIEDKYPGMVDGLPDGVKEKDITDILYKFKYTVGFHGHYEKGLKDGTKIGGYFVNGRDGYSRVVTYVADENGYRPKFKLINLGLDSPDTPKEDTEKTFGLKDFEFVWYPIE